MPEQGGCLVRRRARSGAGSRGARVRAVRILAALAIAFGLMVGGCGSGQASRQDRSVSRSACEELDFDGSDFTVCTAISGQHAIRLALNGRDGKPLRSLQHLADDQFHSAAPAFAMNAGMFDENGMPIGLYVEGGKQDTSLNRRTGPGNFHMLPNGVFYGDAAGWHVATTGAFALQSPPGLQFATQSGPMLVIDGKLHPDFASDGDSRYVRNGVGIGPDGRALFAISAKPVSFGKLARLFRDRLKCRNALYFDGFVSSLWDPAQARRDEGPPLGPLVVVELTRRAAPP
ncbi:MAG: phosphodiester glycosidase family protein [Sphingomonadales bacterium]|nr:phosphodiester glycosidase family protein [Sphingomonadales bacterium]